MEGKFEVAKKIQKANKRKKIKRFWHCARRDWRYQVLFCALLFTIAFFAGRLCQSRKDSLYYSSLLEQQSSEAADELTLQQVNYENLLEQMRLSYETPSAEDEMREEAEYIAKVLYGNARNNSERDQRTLVWCILNRVDDEGYANTVKEVCEQEKQWMGYSDSNPVLQSLYEIAYNELETYYNGYRPVNADYIYMSWSSKEIVLRDTFEVTKNTRYWQAG